jgi:Rab3 GTPase-activating protein non-catalytic subunit
MSCEIQINAIVENLEEVQSFFGLGAISGDFNFSLFSCEGEIIKNLSLIADKAWLNGIFMSAHHDTLSFGYGSKLVIACSKLDKEHQLKVYGSSMKKIQLTDENQIITSIMNITISGGSNYVDWMCVIVGLSSGSLQFYSENGAMLYEKSLHNENILNTRIIGDELTVFYPTCIVVLQVSHLIPLLKSLREMYSKAKTTKIDLMDKDYILAFKKWDYKSNEIVISDAVMIPQQKTCLFDHLVSESLELGFSKKYRITPSQNASVVTVGSKPFVSFHSAREGFRQNVLTGKKQLKIIWTKR